MIRGGDPAALSTDRTFTGQKSDGTGLLYYNARYYDPALGTFLSPDTMVLPLLSPRRQHC
ncbi:MAG: RHS repeat-associated core domain-containing protein [Caldilineaceae bacterium]